MDFATVPGSRPSCSNSNEYKSNQQSLNSSFINQTTSSKKRGRKPKLVSDNISDNNVSNKDEVKMGGSWVDKNTERYKIKRLKNNECVKKYRERKMNETNQIQNELNNLKEEVGCLRKQLKWLTRFIIDKDPTTKTVIDSIFIQIEKSMRTSTTQTDTQTLEMNETNNFMNTNLNNTNANRDSHDQVQLPGFVNTNNMVLNAVPASLPAPNSDKNASEYSFLPARSPHNSLSTNYNTQSTEIENETITNFNTHANTNSKEYVELPGIVNTNNLDLENSQILCVTPSSTEYSSLRTTSAQQNFNSNNPSTETNVLIDFYQEGSFQSNNIFLENEFPKSQTSYNEKIDEISNFDLLNNSYDELLYDDSFTEINQLICSKNRQVPD